MAHTLTRDIKSIFKFRPSRPSTPEPLAHHHPEGILHHAEITGANMSSSTIPSQSPPAAPRPPILIELFQSQGCNACPPTNSNLISFIQSQAQQSPSLNPASPPRFYASRPLSLSPGPTGASSPTSGAGQEYILLTYQVTYWNYLGWTDTFSLPGNDTRQREYVRRMRLEAAYTPMVVVNGRSVGVGNTKSDFDRILRDGTKTQFATTPQVSVQQALEIQNVVDERNSAGVTVEVDATGLLTPNNSVYQPQPANQRAPTLEVWEVTYTPTAQDVHIARGENAGRTLPHINVVKDVKRIGYLEKGSKGRFRVEAQASRRYSQTEERVVIVQDGKGGEVLGVLKVQNERGP
ncbi:hypothetical protein H2200_000192 [Cladophialophora chaetospira]|uniref:DUF1223-domain-containing protein n=1 Tax=Cladophialophora chaetospira TaxID=386627 RepID=A0AA38XMZ1_9EURO|nr:hypothetical protein H2200_000192 [Cladophialophora chaetospira]